MHIYAFGSVCRGEVESDSDVDLLAVVEGRDPRFNQDNFSIYSYSRVRELWEEGNAFAWHLATESKLIYADDGEDFLAGLGSPQEYVNAKRDCERFRAVFDSALLAIENGTPSLVYELSAVFLAIRNIATCYSLARLPQPTFGRHSARRLGQKSVPLSDKGYSILLCSRILSTRGSGEAIDEIDAVTLLPELRNCRSWIDDICQEVAVDG